MRAGVAFAACAVAALVSTGLVACFDLLHGTGDLVTACEIDAAAPGCAAPPAAPVVCSASRAEARQSAAHACAWLGACETPMGRNALGPCFFDALLAFDCDANPNHPVAGKQASLWRCLAASKSCGDVDACVFPAGVQACAAPGAYTSCGSPGRDSGPNDDDVRIECEDGGALPYPRGHGENCALWGQTCSGGNGAAGAVCSPSRTPGCAANECVGTTIDWCSGGVNVGIDCASFGGPGCGGFPTRDAPAWVACLPVGDAGATCTPDLGATCTGGVAESCPAGAPERIDCAALFGSAGSATDAGTCSAGPLDPPFNWGSPCSVDPPLCARDACDGGVATGCAHGGAFSVDCAEAGLGACSMRSTDLGTQEHAACAPP
jgi:hypothetical protein